MWTRQDLKAKAKIAFKANYWRCVLIAFLAMIMQGTVSSSNSKKTTEDIVNGNGINIVPDSVNPAAILAIGVGSILFVLIFIAIDILVINPLVVGCDNFFLNNRRDSETKVSAISFGFNTNYMNIVKVKFLTDLFIALWTLCLIVPGIIKLYEYRFVSYLLSENPDMDYKTAQQTSTQLMNGHKMAAFWLDLSFIGWLILGGITFNLVNVFYTFPYIQATNAELYIALAHPAESDVIEAGGPAVKGAETVEFTVEKNE